MNKSESIKELAAALAKAQAEIGPAAFNRTNPFHKNRYADLGAIIEVARPALAKNNLAFTQLVSGDENKLEVTTALIHSSGEWVETTVGMAICEERGKSAAQVAGSVVTYLRRYSLASMLGIYADEDNDGEKQPAPGAATPAAKPATTVATPPSNGSKPAATASDAMTIEQAEAEMSTTTNETYGAIETEALKHRLAQMLTVKNPTADQARKIAAAKMILVARANGRPVQAVPDQTPSA